MAGRDLVEEKLRLRVDSLAYGGDGVARDDKGRAVFVSGGCPGDEVLAAIDAEHPTYAHATVVEVLEPSPSRVKPVCPHFGRCGGCQWQHVSVEAQRAAKRDIVRDALTRIGGIAEPIVDETLFATEPYGYRNKIELSAGPDERGNLLLGLKAAGSDRIEPIAECHLLPPRARKVPKALSGALRYLSRGRDLALSRVMTRVAKNTRDVEVDLWASPGPFPRSAVARTVREAVPGCDTVTRVLVRDAARDRSRAKVEVLAGRGHWRERMGEFDFRVSAPSFFQVNTDAACLLVDAVLDRLEPSESDRVLDLFAGVGTFTLPLAERADEVVAVESSGPALRDLEANLEAAGLYADVRAGDAGRVLQELGRFDLAVVDPPRSGLDETTADALVATCARRIVYVSCDPATLARDAQRLGTAGYRFVRATPVDLFPQTFHVETVAVFERVGDPTR